MTGEDIVQCKNFLQKLEDASMIMDIHGTRIELLDKNTKTLYGYFDTVEQANIFACGFEWGRDTAWRKSK